MTDDDAKKARWWRRWNWWKIGFFVMLVMFEMTREFAVLASDPDPKVATSAYVGSFGGYTRATGRWVRIDGGDPMVPTAVKISCSQEEGTCVEASAHLYDGYLSEPEVDTFKARFSPEAVAYENDDPTCARYSVRVDLRLKKVFAVRERKANPSNEMCSKLEPKIEMTLGDGYQRNDKPFGNHFVPLFRLVSAFLR